MLTSLNLFWPLFSRTERVNQLRVRTWRRVHGNQVVANFQVIIKTFSNKVCKKAKNGTQNEHCFCSNRFSRTFLGIICGTFFLAKLFSPYIHYVHSQNSGTNLWRNNCDASRSDISQEKWLIDGGRIAMMIVSLNL